ncbi:hypothetical protein JKF63_01155 [Porcisia hertigi]|uniref:Uncharacterized protein n=1 Tax=Porcisia hertigi TaxID=2761500 RepID=A0A836KZ65_9TRYP|nr:hypothetical protein JKF63_01155 [Porcisia hertigi]
MNPQIIDRLGGTSRCMTLFTFSIHFLHSIFSVVNYLSWVRTPGSKLGRDVKVAYLSLVVVSCVFYFFGASVFYMWAWRFPEPEEVARRRRIYGIIINLFFSDLPLFILETFIVFQVHFSVAIMGFNYIFTCVSFIYSALRVWFFLMVRFIKFNWNFSALFDAHYSTRGIAAAQRELDVMSYPGVGGSTVYGGGGVAPPSAQAGNTIVLNRNAGLYSDDSTGVTGLCDTPVADHAYSDMYYNVSPNRHNTPSLNSFSTPQEARQRGYSRGIRASAYSPLHSTFPSRI